MNNKGTKQQSGKQDFKPLMKQMNVDVGTLQPATNF